MPHIKNQQKKEPLTKKAKAQKQQKSNTKRCSRLGYHIAKIKVTFFFPHRVFFFFVFYCICDGRLYLRV